MKQILTVAAIVLALYAPVQAQDAIDLSQAVLVGGADVRTWPVSTTITSVSTSTQGIEAQFSKRSDWPDITPAGWDGPVYYTVWLGARLSDGVHLAAALNVYRGQIGSGAGDVTNIGQYSENLWYLDSALKAHVTQEGETLYLLVTAGAARGVTAISVQERSNVVAFTAASAPRTFTFTTDPPPVVTPPVDPPVSDALAARIEYLAELAKTFAAQLATLEGRVTALEAKPIPTKCRVLGGAVSCVLQ